MKKGEKGGKEKFEEGKREALTLFVAN